MKAILSIIMAILIFGLTTQSFAATTIDPALEWRTIETKHFKIHYYPAEEKEAQRVASFMEEVHQNLQKVIKREPEGKTDIVLMDQYDTANGMATPFPKNTIYIYITPMSVTENFATKYEEWLKIVLIHEYLHIYHTDRTEGWTDVMRRIYGTAMTGYTFLFEPTWSPEGLAVYTETRFTTGGRGLDPYTDMKLRSQFLEGEELHQEQINGRTMSRKFYGDAPYLYGVKLWQHIAKTYGEDTLDKITEVYSAEPLAGFNSAIKKVTGDEFDLIWSNFISSTRETYMKQADEIKAKGLTPSIPLTRIRFGTNASPKWSNDGQKIYYHSNSPDEEPSVKEIDLSDGSEKTLIKDVNGKNPSFSMDSQGNFVYQKMEIYKNLYVYSDLFRHDTQNGTKHLTVGGRGLDPAISPDGKKIIFVTSHGTSQNLMLLENGKITPLTMLEYAEFATPVWSPEGRKIAVSRKLAGYNELCLVSPDGAITPVFEDKSRAANITPSFSPDGRYLLFSSDRTGVYNLYGYDLKENKLHQITNVLGGAFYPSVSPGSSKIAFSSYTWKGMDIHVMDYDPASWQEVAVPSPGSGELGTQIRDNSLLNGIAIKDEVASADVRLTLGDTFTSKPYSPISSLMPTWWAPTFTFDEQGYGPGLFTFNNDVLKQHSYSVFAGVGGSGRLAYALNYTNDQLPPSISFDLSDDANWVQRHQARGITMTYRQNLDLDAMQTFSIGYQADLVTNVAATAATPGNFAGVSLGYQLNNVRKHRNSISPEEGGSFGLNALFNSKGLGSDFNTSLYTANGNIYFPLSENHHVLALEGIGAASAGDLISLYDNTVFVRGYPYGYLTGTGLWKGSIEYRFPISVIESGPRDYPLSLIYFDQQWGSLFLEAGAPFGSLVSTTETKTSAGIQYNLDTYAFYNLPLTFSVYYAYGFNQGGESQVGLTLSSKFLPF